MLIRGRYRAIRVVTSVGGFCYTCAVTQKMMTLEDGLVKAIQQTAADLSKLQSATDTIEAVSASHFHAQILHASPVYHSNR
jgi:hypothetical protein